MDNAIDKTKAKTKTKDLTKKKKIFSIIIFIIGLITLITGVVFLVLNILKMNTLQDGEYLISVNEWALDEGTNCDEATEAENTEEANAETNCSPSVVWKFTEIGKGTLTTNNHLNDYDFTWAIEDGKLLIQTDWLYELENEYEYSLDQGAGVLTLTDGEEIYKFVAQ